MRLHFDSSSPLLVDQESCGWIAVVNGRGAPFYGFDLCETGRWRLQKYDESDGAKAYLPITLQSGDTERKDSYLVQMIMIHGTCSIYLDGQLLSSASGDEFPLRSISLGVDYQQNQPSSLLYLVYFWDFWVTYLP